MQPTGVIENSKATKNPLKELLNYGQSMWLDYIRRDLFTTGKLTQLILEDGLRGMTSNPSIFEKAIGDSSLYDDVLHSLASRKDLDTTGKYEQIAIRDIQDAAYKESVLPSNVTARVSVEMASTFGWGRYTGLKGRNVGMHRFGASAPLKDLLKYFGFTVDTVVAEALSAIAGK